MDNKAQSFQELSTKVRGLIATDNFIEAINLLKPYDQQDLIASLEGRHSSLLKNQIQGVVDFGDKTKESNDLRQGLLNFLTILEKSWPKEGNLSGDTSYSESEVESVPLKQDQQSEKVESDAKMGMIGAGVFLLIIIISIFWKDLKWAIFPDFHQNKLTTLFADSLMVKVEGGAFTLGPIPDQVSEYTTHQVNISDFYISKHEISQEQYSFVLRNTLEDDDDYRHENHHLNCPKCPVDNVSDQGIQLFLDGLEELTGKPYRLPTEAEWEYAARGGQENANNFRFSGSNTLDEVGWNQRNANNETHEVGHKEPNELGLYDMTGNVNEWVKDTWHETYEGAPTNGSEWVGTSGRVIRGGGYKNAGETCLTTYRYRGEPNQRYEDVGFRIVLPLDKGELNPD